MQTQNLKNQTNAEPYNHTNAREVERLESVLDTMRTQLAERDALLLWALYHHQGGKSEVGQPIRQLLEIGQHDHLTNEQIERASKAAHTAPKRPAL